VYNSGGTAPSYAASPVSVTLDGTADVVVEFTASGATKTLQNVQLEAGSKASAFEYRPIGTELALCQRYFQKYVDPPLRGVASQVNLAARIGMVLPVPLRATPSSSNIFAGTLSFYDGSGATTYSSINASYLKNTHIEFDLATTSGFTVGRGVSLYQGGGGTMSLDAEL